MANYNKVLLMGNLTRDPELKRTSSDMAVAQLSIASNRRYKDKMGELKEETTFVDCEAWGKTAETMAKYLAKGRPVFVEGRLKLDQWQDKDGNNRSKLKVVIENFQFVLKNDTLCWIPHVPDNPHNVMTQIRNHTSSLG